MAVSSTTNRINYNGDGTSAVFAFQYEFHSQADLDVYVWNSSRAVIQTQQTLNTDFTISGTADAQGRYKNGGNVVFNSTPAQGDVISIVRDTAPSQPFNLRFNQTVPSAEFEKALDRIALLEQRQNSLSQRTLRLADGYPLTFSGELPQIFREAGAPLIVGSNLNNIELGPVVQFGSNVSGLVGTVNISQGGLGQSFDGVEGILYHPGNSQPVTNIGSSQEGNVLVAHGSSGPPTFQAHAVANSGVVNVANGGTGTPTVPPAYAVIYQQSSLIYGNIPSSDDGKVLTCHGSGIPTWESNSVYVTGSTGQVLVSQGPGVDAEFELYPNLSVGARNFDDFLAGIKTVDSVNSGAGSGVSYQDGRADGTNHPGVVGISCGSAFGGLCFLGNEWAKHTGTESYVKSCFKVDHFPDGTSDYVLGVGWAGDSLNSAPTHSALLFFNSSLSTNFICKTSNGGSATHIDTGVALQASTWYTAMTYVHSGFSQVDFYLGTSSVLAIVGSSTTNIPDLEGDRLYSGVYVSNLNGTETVLAVDYVDTWYKVDR